MRYIDHIRRLSAYRHVVQDNWSYEQVAKVYNVTLNAVEAMMHGRKMVATRGLGEADVVLICSERDAGCPLSDIALYWNLPESVILGLNKRDPYVPGRRPKPAGYVFPRDKYDALIAEYDSRPPKTETRKSIAAKYGLTENQLSWIVSGNAQKSRVVSPEVRAQIMEDIEALNSKSIKYLAQKYAVPYSIARSWVGNHLKEKKEAEADGLTGPVR